MPDDLKEMHISIEKAWRDLIAIKPLAASNELLMLSTLLVAIDELRTVRDRTMDKKHGLMRQSDLLKELYSRVITLEARLNGIDAGEPTTGTTTTNTCESTESEDKIERLLDAGLWACRQAERMSLLEKRMTALEND